MDPIFQEVIKLKNVINNISVFKEERYGINNAAADGPWLTVVQLNEFLT